MTDQNYYEVTEKDFELTLEEIEFDAFDGYYKYEHEREVSEGLESLFIKNRFSDGLNDLNFIEKWFYWFKTFVCVCLGRVSGWAGCDIDVVYFDEHYSGGEYGGTSWTTLTVREGVFKNWYVGYYKDSSC